MEFLRAWFDLSYDITKCAALFPGSLVITIYNLAKLKKFDIVRVMQNFYSKSFKQKIAEKLGSNFIEHKDYKMVDSQQFAVLSFQPNFCD